jgi:hypothetical protein
VASAFGRSARGADNLTLVGNQPLLEAGCSERNRVVDPDALCHLAVIRSERGTVGAVR